MHLGRDYKLRILRTDNCFWIRERVVRSMGKEQTDIFTLINRANSVSTRQVEHNGLKCGLFAIHFSFDNN